MQQQSQAEVEKRNRILDAKKKNSTQSHDAAELSHQNSNTTTTAAASLLHLQQNGEDEAISLRLLMAETDVNVGVRCIGCGEDDFIGYRFKCCHCKNYDLCADCFEARKAVGKHSPAHPMYFIRSPLTSQDNTLLTTIFNMGSGALLNFFKKSVFKVKPKNKFYTVLFAP